MGTQPAVPSNTALSEMTVYASPQGSITKPDMSATDRGPMLGCKPSQDPESQQSPFIPLTSCDSWQSRKAAARGRYSDTRRQPSASGLDCVPCTQDKSPAVAVRQLRWYLHHAAHWTSLATKRPVEPVVAVSIKPCGSLPTRVSAGLQHQAGWQGGTNLARQGRSFQRPCKSPHGLWLQSRQFCLRAGQPLAVMSLLCLPPSPGNAYRWQRSTRQSWAWSCGRSGRGTAQARTSWSCCAERPSPRGARGSGHRRSRQYSGSWSRWSVHWSRASGWYEHCLLCQSQQLGSRFQDTGSRWWMPKARGSFVIREKNLLLARSQLGVILRFGTSNNHFASLAILRQEQESSSPSTWARLTRQRSGPLSWALGCAWWQPRTAWGCTRHCERGAQWSSDPGGSPSWQWRRCFF